jgi:3-mercaptopropionate dioxygenase
VKFASFTRDVGRLIDDPFAIADRVKLLPGQQTPIHDHASWCVAGVYRGTQRQSHFSLIEWNWRPCLVHAGTFEAPAGHVEVFVPPAQNVHSVTAVGEDKTISIPVYGADSERLSWRRYDDIPQFVHRAERRFPDA